MSKIGTYAFSFLFFFYWSERRKIEKNIEHKYTHKIYKTCTLVLLDMLYCHILTFKKTKYFRFQFFLSINVMKIMKGEKGFTYTQMKWQKKEKLFAFTNFKLKRYSSMYNNNKIELVALGKKY